MIDGYDAIAIALVGLGGYLLGSAKRSDPRPSYSRGGYQPVPAQTGSGLTRPPHQGSGGHPPDRKVEPSKTIREVYNCCRCDDTGYKDHAGFAMDLCDCRHTHGD